MDGKKVLFGSSSLKPDRRVDYFPVLDLNDAIPMR